MFPWRGPLVFEISPGTAVSRKTCRQTSDAARLTRENWHEQCREDVLYKCRFLNIAFPQERIKLGYYNDRATAG